MAPSESGPPECITIPILPEPNGAAPKSERPRRTSVAALDSAHHSHVLRRGAFLALHGVELHLLALSQRLEPGSLDGRVVDEAVLLAVFPGDEPEAFGVVEPLHGALRTHNLTP